MPEIYAHILGQAQRSFSDVDAVDHPLQLMCDIAEAALEDAGIEASAVDAIGCVDPLSWTYADLASKVANSIGCKTDVREFWLPAGGTTPLDLLHEVTNAMARREIDIAVLVGAEAMRTRRKAARAGNEPDWPPRDKNVKPMRGQKPFTSAWEAKHGLRLPIQSFPMLENAIRADKGKSADEQIMCAAGLLHKNALVAASNPDAWFRDAPGVEDIATVTKDNRMISYPYAKRMNAIMDVDQAAAVVVVSDSYLERRSADRAKAAAILAGAGAEEVWNPMERRSLATCVAMHKALNTALEDSGLKVSDIDAFDFYSCFPAPVQMALDALQMDTSDARQFSITGGLAYAGGPGNNYVMHSLATAVKRLRNSQHEKLMITGIGMANTKHAATLLSSSANIPYNAIGRTQYRVETGDQALAVAQQASGECTIATYTIEYDRDGNASNIIYILDTIDGKRAIANSANPARDEADLLASDPIGRIGQLRWDEEKERQFFRLGPG